MGQVFADLLNFRKLQYDDLRKWLFNLGWRVSPWRCFLDKDKELIKILRNSSVLFGITEEMKSDLVGAEGNVLPLILAEILKKLLKTTQKTTHGKR